MPQLSSRIVRATQPKQQLCVLHACRERSGGNLQARAIVVRRDKELGLVHVMDSELKVRLGVVRISRQRGFPFADGGIVLARFVEQMSEMVVLEREMRGRGWRQGVIA